MFNSLVREVSLVLPDLGARMAIDGKALPSAANRCTETNDDEEKSNRRAEHDADGAKHPLTNRGSPGIILCFAHELQSREKSIEPARQ